MSKKQVLAESRLAPISDKLTRNNLIEWKLLAYEELSLAPNISPEHLDFIVSGIKWKPQPFKSNSVICKEIRKVMDKKSIANAIQAEYKEYRAQIKNVREKIMPQISACLLLSLDEKVKQDLESHAGYSAWERPSRVQNTQPKLETLNNNGIFYYYLIVKECMI